MGDALGVTRLVEGRYTVLDTVAHSQPIGRRTLSQKLGWPARSMVHFLHEQGFLETRSTGMVMSDASTHLLDRLGDTIEIDTR